MQHHVAGTVQALVHHLVPEVVLPALHNLQDVTILAKILAKKPVLDLHLATALAVTTHVLILAAKAVPMIVQVAVMMVATRDVHLNVAKDVQITAQMDVVMVVKQVVKLHVL